MALLASSCGGWLSPVTYAEVSCSYRDASATALVGQPLDVVVTWPRMAAVDAKVTPENIQEIFRSPFIIDVQCKGVPCAIAQEVEEGKRSITVTPTRPGRLVIHVALDDRKQPVRYRIYGPIDVQAATSTSTDAPAP
ncbi:Hypothetical protein CAP_4859 [Chondromyces apiculatus DSM 436]|uniref:Uncharacterized protein n=1 Tax=Chondromyces apiculatus DSM 436 TaxID=1192034 RepID=A0A017T6H9_9BACT|nr:Hypothetical protein CAP_4859 [Chondromyces apiculatus DSM 436]